MPIFRKSDSKNLAILLYNTTRQIRKLKKWYCLIVEQDMELGVEIHLRFLSGHVKGWVHSCHLDVIETVGARRAFHLLGSIYKGIKVSNINFQSTRLNIY